MNAQVNRPSMGAVYDTLTGVFLLTQEKTFVTDEQYATLAMWITNPSALYSLKSRLIKYGISVNSGKAVFSALLPPDFCYYKYDTENEVEIRDGILIRGMITKDHIGTTHRSIVQILRLNYGQKRTADFLTDLPFVINQWLNMVGFTVGIKDCLPKDPQIEQTIRDEIAKIRLAIAALGEPPIDPDENAHWEMQVVSYLDSVSKIGGMLIKKNLNPENAFRVMAVSKAKGTEFNVSQIMAFIGQQFFRGQRLKGTLAYFDPNSEKIEARGFIDRNFMKGLTVDQMFSLLRAGREGLMDTALNTANSGAAHHRVVKALESDVAGYDGSVRNSVGSLFQFCAGEDGFDAAYLQNTSTSVGVIPSFIDINETGRAINCRYGF